MANKTRKEVLKTPDEFITFTGRMIRFVKEYKVQVLSTIAGICIVFLLAFGIRYYLEKVENDSFALLQKSMSKYETQVKDNEPSKAYQAVKGDFEELLSKYSGNGGGKLARVVLANLCYNGDDPDRAIELYNLSLLDFDQHPSIKSLILNGLAYAYEKKKDYPNAIKYFEMVSSSSDSVLKDDAFFNLGRLYAAAGEKDKSITAYKKIISDYPKSMYIELVKEKVSG